MLRVGASFIHALRPLFTYRHRVSTLLRSHGVWTSKIYSEFANPLDFSRSAYYTEKTFLKETMKIFALILILLVSTVAFALEKTDHIKFLNCVKETSFNMPPTQSTFGDFIQISRGDTTAGKYFLLPPRGTFITVGDTVEFVPMSDLDDPWFSILIDRNPISREQLYHTGFSGDSVAFVIFDYESKDPKFPNIRMAYDRNVCEPFSMTLSWPDSANHGFPGADRIYYEFVITNQMSIAPALRVDLDKTGKPVERFIYETVDIIGKTPGDDVIIQFLMGKTELEKHED